MKKVQSTLFTMVLTLFVITGVSAVSLGYVYSITKAPIDASKQVKELAAISEVVYPGFDNKPNEEVLYIDDVTGNGKLELYPARKDGKVTSVAIKTYTNNGFSGRIEMIIGFFLDGTINKYKVTSQMETPGLGTKITEDKFKTQFEGKNPKYFKLQVKKDGGDVDAVTAATISSRAVANAVDRAYKSYIKFDAGK